MADKKVGFVVTHAEDEPELATIPFVLSTGAMTMNVEPVIILQGEGVKLAIPGGADAVAADGFPRLADLLDGILASGHRVMVCSPCAAKRGVTEDMLRDGFFIAGAGQVIASMLECENFLRY